MTDPQTIDPQAIAADTPFLRLDGRRVTLILALTPEGATVPYWGPMLPPTSDPTALARLLAREEAPGSPAVEATLTLTPQAGTGFPGHPGLIAHRDGRNWAGRALLTAVHRPGPGRVAVESTETAHGYTLVQHLHLDPDGDVLTAQTEIRNTGDSPLVLDWLAACTLPVPPWLTLIRDFTGTWAGEFRDQAQERRIGTWMRENRRGRTSHDAFPLLLLESAAVTETAGEVMALHLGWSGNHRTLVDSLSDGRAQVQAGELFLPGEMRLEPAAVYRTPVLYATVAGAGREAGRGAIARAFQAHVRARPEHARLRAKPRPVHYNTWEAVYFDHDPAVLLDLAERAAAVGVERFVLDDGWFPARRSDRAGLGDWIVDRTIYLDGLGPLAEKVRSLGMEFGLWVEPEMVNPDSDLYRAHPDWVLATPPAPQLSFRNQLVLDFGRAEVRDHLFARIDALLREYPIAYLKWDMNRDLSHPGGADGRPGTHAHVRGLYEVLARLRSRHPGVEIESCASGGGRADLGVLALTDRVWTSDSNDALDRLWIQRGLSTLLPAEVTGAHVGPTDCHITGRRLSMALRVATALFGHMGVEADLRALADEETAELAAGIALHKRHRALIHGGELHRLDTPAAENAFAIIAPDGGEALVSHTRIREPGTYLPGRLRLSGLDPAARYRVTLVWPGVLKTLSPVVADLRHGLVADGALLMQAGLQLPRTWPQTAMILHLVRLAD
ncbi:MAG: hypothetical protein RLY86_1006 [Pseudomonadota bacterium]|jgi:alpha-galactosidase